MKKKVSIVLVIVFILNSVMCLSADKLYDTKKQKERIDSEIYDISNQKKEEKKKLNSAIEEKEYITAVENNQTNQYEKLQADHKALVVEITKIEESIDKTMDEYREQERLFKVRLKAMYESSYYCKANTLAKSKNVTDFFARLKYISAISKKDKQLIDDIYTAKNDIEYKRKIKDKLRLDKEDKIKEKKEQIDSLEASKSNIEEEIQNINTKLENLEEQEDDLIKKSGELTTQIRNLQRKGRYIGGRMTWPVPSSYSISSYYGVRFHPVLKKNKMHTGIDISAGSGSSIVSANKGVVILASWQGGYGNTVIVDHGGGIATLYAHCSSILVGVGQSVDTGEVIAKVGSTGLSTGPHLHFEVRTNGSTVNPLGYLK